MPNISTRHTIKQNRKHKEWIRSHAASALVASIEMGRFDESTPSSSQSIKTPTTDRPARDAGTIEIENHDESTADLRILSMLSTLWGTTALLYYVEGVQNEVVKKTDIRVLLHKSSVFDRVLDLFGKNIGGLDDNDDLTVVFRRHIGAMHSKPMRFRSIRFIIYSPKHRLRIMRRSLLRFIEIHSLFLNDHNYQ